MHLTVKVTGVVTQRLPHVLQENGSFCFTPPTAKPSLLEDRRKWMGNLLFEQARILES
jgi:hypothetical protein